MATTTKVFNIAGGKHSAEAYSSFEGLLYGSCVASGLTVTKSSSNMNCFINSGAGLIMVGSTYARRFAIEGGTLTATVSAASATLARRDTIVLYVDNSVTPTTSVEDNTNNILKGMVVAGTPAQNPAAPNATTIQSAVGAGNPYIILYDILVPANATNLSTATLYDRRVMAAKALFDALPNGSITSQKLATAVVDTYSYKPGEVITLSSQKLGLLIAGSGGAQEYFLPLSKSLDRVTGATVKITSAASSNSFRTIDTSYGAGKPTENVDYTGTLVGNGIKFTATLKAGSSNGHINDAQIGIGAIGTITVTFS